MNIQIFGKSKSFDTKKAERWFKERGIKFQAIDLARYGMSRGEFDSVKRAVGSIEALIDEKAKGAAALKYLAYESDRRKNCSKNPLCCAHRSCATANRRPLGISPTCGSGGQKSNFFIEYYYKQSLLE